MLSQKASARIHAEARRIVTCSSSTPSQRWIAWAALTTARGMRMNQVRIGRMVRAAEGGAA